MPKYILVMLLKIIFFYKDNPKIKRGKMLHRKWVWEKKQNSGQNKKSQSPWTKNLALAH